MSFEKRKVGRTIYNLTIRDDNEKLYMQYVCEVDGERTSEISDWWKGRASRDDILSADEVARTINSPSDPLSGPSHCVI